MRDRGLRPEDLPSLSLSELRAGGFSCLDLALMATARELRHCGFSVSDLRKTGGRAQDDISSEQEQETYMNN